MIRFLWNTALTLSLTAFLIVMVTMTIHERVRWNECMKQCEDQRYRNDKMIRSEVCVDHPDHLPCYTAKQENDMWPIACTARKYWQQSEVCRLYNMYAESHLMLFGLSAIALAVFIHQMFSLCKETSSNSKEEFQQQAVLSAISAAAAFNSLNMQHQQLPAAAAAAPPVKQKKRRRLKSYYSKEDAYDLAMERQRQEMERRREMEPFPFEMMYENDDDNSESVSYWDEDY